MEPNGRDVTHGSMDDALRDRLLEDLRLVVEDAQDLLRHGSAQAAERYQQVRDRLESTLGSARENWAVAEQRLVESTRYAVRRTDHFVQEHPWQAVGVGAAAGLLLGLLLGRSRRHDAGDSDQD